VVEEVAASCRMKRRARREAADRVSGNSAKVAASAEALHDIVSNLVVNALEATPRGGRVLWQRIRTAGSVRLRWKTMDRASRRRFQEKILQPFLQRNRRGLDWAWPLWRGA